MNSRIPSVGLEVRTVALDHLLPAPYNPRLRLKPTDPAYRKLEASLREFGLVEPLVWNENTGRVVGGHARLRILRKLGVKEIPVSVVHLSEEREKALNVVLNNQEAQGRYDTEKLADLLTELEDLPELEMTGFDANTLDVLRFDPIQDEEEEAIVTGCVSLTLEMERDTYERLAPKLDPLIAEFDLTCHVRKI